MTKTQAFISTVSNGNDLCVFRLKFHQLFALLHLNRSRQLCLLENISYKDLKKATDSFRRIVNCDPKATIYEAKFENGSVCAVREVIGLYQEKEVFYKEVLLLGRLCHRNVMSLRGYTFNQRSFLVFESTAQGSLKDHLNDPLRTPLSWKIRVQIAIAVAAALEYLQCFCDPPVYHISISSSNIILDEKFTPKLFLTQFLNVGYLSSTEIDGETPEASKARQDLIPQFGALMLELITGQAFEKGSADVSQWIQEAHFSVSLDNMIDPDLGNGYSSKELRDALALARLCLKAENQPAFTISHISLYLRSRFSNACG